MLKRLPRIILPHTIPRQSPSIEHAFDGLREGAPEGIDDEEAVFVGVGDVGWVLGGGGVVGLVGAVEPGPGWNGR